MECDRDPDIVRVFLRGAIPLQMRDCRIASLDFESLRTIVLV